MRDGRSDDEEELCCCEYLSDIHYGERKHLMQLCCDCRVFDDISERLIRCQPVPSSRLRKLWKEMRDRARVPSPGGATKLDIRHVLPFFIYPLLVYCASFGFVYSVFAFLITMAGFTGFSFRQFANREPNIAATMMLVAYMITTYTIYVLYFYPKYTISPEWLAVQHLCIILFCVFFVFTISGPGFVPLKSSGKSGGSYNFIRREDVTVEGEEDGQSVTAQITVGNDGAIRQVDPTAEMNAKFIEANPNFAAPEMHPAVPTDAKFIKPEDNVAVSQEDMVRVTRLYWPVLQWPEWSFCSECKIMVPPKSGHCRTCKRCVYNMDHHCFWLDTCVGMKNMRWFVLMLVTMLGGSFLNAHLVFNFVCPPDSGKFCYGIWQTDDAGDRLVFVTTVYSVIFSVYLIQPLIRILITILLNVSNSRLNKFVRFNARPENEKLSWGWLFKFHRGILRNLGEVACPPNLWDIADRPAEAYVV